jgi:hypothetical protein
MRFIEQQISILFYLVLVPFLIISKLLDLIISKNMDHNLKNIDQYPNINSWLSRSNNFIHYLWLIQDELSDFLTINFPNVKHDIKNDLEKIDV